MTITGKRNHTIKKVDRANQKSAAVGFSKVVFFHKATAGDTTINLGGLSMPTEISSAGYTNPSPSELASLNLSLIRNNLKLVSSRGVELIPGLSYTASGLTITLSDSYGPALADEIFTGVIDPVIKSGAEIIDANPLVSTGVLAAGTQDYNVGQPFEVNKYPNAQVGAVLVFVDGVLQFRGNPDGNYTELAATGGTLATIIRLNQTEAYDRNILVVSNGLLSERPSESVKAEVERLQGQIDSLVATTAVLAGVPESSFQAAPNSVDLKQFGDRVLAMESNRARIDQDNDWTAAQSLIGVTDGSPADAGEIGELKYINATGTTTAATNVSFDVIPGQSITLTPGEWDINAVVGFDFGGTPTSTGGYAIISTSGSPPAPSFSIAYNPNASGEIMGMCQGSGTAGETATEFVVHIPTYSINITSPVTLRLYARWLYTGGSSLTTRGWLRARRVR